MQHQDEHRSINVGALGPLRVLVDGEPRQLAPAQRRLLSILLLEADRGASTDRIIERMWDGDPPATARAALQVHVSKIRSAVPVVTTPNGYRLDMSAVSLDVDELEAAATAVAAYREEGDWEAVLDAAARIRELRRGEPFPDVADDDFARGVRAGLDEMAFSVAEAEVEALLALGRNEYAIARLEELIERRPLQDRLRHRHMLALYRTGRQGEALRVYQAYRRLLGDTMGVEPGPELRALEERILLHDPDLGAAETPASPHNLPDTETSFVGRDAELERLTTALDAHRVVTICGGPGFGKTRLAVEVGRSRLGAQPGGVWLAALGGAIEPRDVAATIASATGAGEGVDGLEALASMLADRPILLVLDNCEHVLEAVRRFVVALGGGDHPCRVLATSRRPLGVPGESVHRIHPLSVDANGSVALLADRIRAIVRTFAVTDDNRDAMLDVCRRLEGIPLAIELVARWVPTLGLEDAARLLMRVEVETALDTAFEWSLGLLPPEDRSLLFRLAVFESAFRLERAVDVVGGDRSELAVAGAMSRLVDASLLGMEWSGSSTVYRMLRPIRDLAWSRLETDTREAVAGSHAASFLDSSARIAQDSIRGRQSAAFAALDTEMPDYRRALVHLRELERWGDVVGVTESLSRYWYARFLGWEGRSWLREVPLDRLDDAGRARLHRTAGFLAWATHAYDDADAHYLALQEIGVSIGDRRLEADGLYGRGLVHQKRRFLDGAAMLDEAASIYARLDGCERQLGECLMFRGIDEAAWGSVARAEPKLIRAATLLEQAGHLRQVSKAERWLAHCAWRREDLDAAERHADRAERLARDVDDDIAVAGALVEQANIAIALDAPGRAASALADALEPVPSEDEIDVVQVLLPVARLAAHVGRSELAAAIVRHVDATFDRYGWRPLDELAVGTALRAATDGVEPAPGAVDVLVGEFLEVLSDG